MGRRRAGSSRRVGASSLRWWAASSRRAAASSLRRRAASSRGPPPPLCVGGQRAAGGLFFCFGTGSTPPVVEPAVMTLFITVELNPTPLKTGGDGHFEPAVMRGAGVVDVPWPGGIFTRFFFYVC